MVGAVLNALGSVVKVIEFVLEKLEGCAEGGGSCTLYAGGSKWCALCAMGSGVHVLHDLLYVALYSRGGGGRTSFARFASRATFASSRCLKLSVLHVLEAEKDVRYTL